MHTTATIITEAITIFVEKGSTTVNNILSEAPMFPIVSFA